MGNPYSNPAASKEVYFFMKNLMTRKIAFGLLIAFVLALGVHGIAESVTLTATSDTTQEKQPNDVPFKLNFSVGLTSPKDINDYNQNSRHIKATAADINYAAGTSTRANVSTTATIIVDAAYSAGDTHYSTVTAITTNTSITGVAAYPYHSYQNLGNRHYPDESKFG